MKVALIPGRELSADLILVWAELQRNNPHLASPFFHPEFTHIIACVRNDVEVAVIEDGSRIIAFFPFQRLSGTLGKPVGGIISDYQGLICPQDFVWDPRELLRACGLVAWDFDHLVASQALFGKCHQIHEQSPQIDLQYGFDEYVKERRAAGSEQIKKCFKSVRRLEREIGALRFTAHETDRAVLEQTLAWKSQQYNETGKTNLFGSLWVRRALDLIHMSSQSSEWAGMLSCLYAGEQLIAGHFGIRGATVWHYWFPAYNREMAVYSPGLILLLKIAEHASDIGLRIIDLGKGMSLYKRRIMNTSVVLASGSIETRSMLAVRRAAARNLRSLKSVIAAPVREIFSSLGVLREKAMCEK
jgi:CelD/BcsL family acetyltransferase involved in cellulose biosynthesis